jgi:hypothetical protein
MRKVLRAFLRRLAAVYHRCAAPAYHRMRQDLQVEALHEELHKAAELLEHVHRLYLEYHTALTQQVAEELAGLRRRLDSRPPAERAA